MIFNKFFKFGRNTFKLGGSVLSAGKSLALYGKDLVYEKVLRAFGAKGEKEKASAPGAKAQTKSPLEVSRENLKKNFEIPNPNDPIIKGKMQSMQKSQGETDFSGSSYDGADSPGQRTNYNKLQRNYDNHQGN